MSAESRPLWFEGQLVRPQHLQLLVRWTEGDRGRHARALRPDGYGVHTIEIDESLLALGRVGLRRGLLVLPDGSVIDIPGRDAEPPALRIPPEAAGRTVRLALPLQSGDAREVGPDARYTRQTQPVRDSTGDGTAQDVAVGAANLRLLLEGEADGDLVTLPIARIRQVDAAGAVQLDPGFIPPSLRLGAHPALAGYARDVQGMLAGRGASLAARIDPARAGADLAGMIDFALLQLVNAHEPAFAWMAEGGDLPPMLLHAEMLRLAGALATFSRTDRRPPPFPAWRHAVPAESLSALLAAIRTALGVLTVDAAVSLPLEQRGKGIWISPIRDRALLGGARFVLMVSAALDPERIRAGFPSQAKIGPAEAIQDLVNLQLPGIGLQPLPVAPRELPYRAGTVYLELDRSGPLWRQLARSPAFVIHVGADLPELSLEFWAVRQG